jgi:tetratricopeptide (TPR) repeat protein
MKSKKFLFLIVSIGLIISVSIFFIFKEKPSVESVKTEKSNKEDTNEKVIKRIDSLFNVKPDSAIAYTRMLLKSDSTSIDSNLYITLITEIAVVKSMKGEIDSGLHYLNQASDYWKKDTSFLGQKHYGIILNDIAFFYSYFGENKKALSNYKQAGEIAGRIGEKDLAISVNIQLSSLYQSMGDYSKALECIEKTIQICYLTKDSMMMISSLQSYADLYSNCYLFDEALVQFDDVLNYKDHFTTYSRFCFYNSKGRMFYLKGDYRNAKSDFSMAFKNVDKNDLYTFLIPVSNLAETSLLLGEVDSAKVYLDIIEQNYEGINNFPLLKFNYHSLLGEYYRLKGQYVLAQRSFAVSDAITQKQGIDKVLLKLHKKRKARFYEETNQFRDAFTEMKEYNNLNESVLEENSRNQVAGLKYKFQRDTTITQQRNNIKMSNQRIETFKYLQIIYIVSISALLLLLLLIYLFYKKTRALNREKNMRKMAAMKMENIRGRISPHFVFNVLNNIWAIIDDREHARAQFDNLTKLIRRSLVNTEQLAIPLNEEIDFVKSFIELQKLMMDDDLDVIWNIDSEIDLTQPVPGMILQIPVENAIKHGLAPKKDNRVLTIDITYGSSFVQFVIADNGIGLQQGSSPTKGTGTGLKVLTNTIHILNQINEKKMTYEILNRKDGAMNGAKVIIKIPFQYNYDLS